MRKLLFILLVGLLASACSSHTGEKEPSSHHHGDHESESYTCPMHPDVVSDKPGKCPVCGMDLVVKKSSSQTSTLDLMLTDNQIRLANITTQRVSAHSIGQSAVINGRLTENALQSQVISSRVSGRVEKLMIKETGKPIRKGEPLFQIYSEELLVLQREFLLAKEQLDQLGTKDGKYQSFYDAARRKLLLYGLNETQVDRLAKDKQVHNSTTYVSPVNGIVTEITINEGQQVSEGTTIMKIENITTLWLEAELYTNESASTNIGDEIFVRVAGFENDPIRCVVDFLSPEYRGGSQILIMRATVPNTDYRFKPGMQARVTLSKSGGKSVAVPLEAVVADENGAHVYVQRGKNTFRPVIVKTGSSDLNRVEIKDGLSIGDTVAISGAYLLYSEFVLKKGKDPVTIQTHTH